MSNNLKKILSVSPFLEVLIRHIYWGSPDIFNKLVGYFPKSSKLESFSQDLDSAITSINNLGIINSEIVVVHSSYDSLKHTNLSPQSILTQILQLVGLERTVVMPAFPVFKEKKTSTYLADINETYTYHVGKNKIWTGVLPFLLMKQKNAVISRHPLNSVVAIGPYAEEMTARNLDGVEPLPCGANSAWKFCYDKNALILGLGIDLVHSLTIMHVAEDCWEDEWNKRNWYRKRKFNIIDKEFKTEIVVRERKPVWGTKHFAEQTLRKELLKNKILFTINTGNIRIEYLNAQHLIDFLRSKNKNGFPYYWL